MTDRMTPHTAARATGWATGIGATTAGLESGVTAVEIGAEAVADPAEKLMFQQENPHGFQTTVKLWLMVAAAERGELT